MNSDSNGIKGGNHPDIRIRSYYPYNIYENLMNSYTSCEILCITLVLTFHLYLRSEIDEISFH